MLESTSGLSEKKELEKLQERSVKQLCPQWKIFFSPR
jgi:hypothetical protein